MLQKFAWLRRCSGIAVIGCVLVSTALPSAAALSAVDREAIEAAFARADRNGDGRLSREEAQRFPEIAARFEELDTDHDGFLSLMEFSVGATPPVRQ